MSRIHKCTHCKNMINNLDDEISFITGKKIQVKKYAHKRCRHEAVMRNEFYKLLLEILNTPTIGDSEYTILDREHKKGFSYEVMIHAINEKREKLRRDITDGDMGWVITTIRGQLANSKNVVEEEERKKKEREQNKKILEQNVEIIKVKANTLKDVNIIDISNMEDL